MQNPRHNHYLCFIVGLFSDMNSICYILQSTRSSTVAFTGRRTYAGEADEELRLLVHDLCERGFTRFLCGMSWGFDLAAGRIVAEYKATHPYVELIAVEPFEGFRQMFTGEDAACYDALMAAADERIVVSDEKQGAYMLRNDFLVDNASIVVAWWDNLPTGGTEYTVKRARKCRVEVVNLYPDPQLDLF